MCLKLIFYFNKILKNRLTLSGRVIVTVSIVVIGAILDGDGRRELYTGEEGRKKAQINTQLSNLLFNG